VQSAGPGIRLEWNLGALERFMHSPAGGFRPGADKLAAVVVAGAKARALVRTGRMKDEITAEILPGPNGLLIRIISPATNPADGFNYPLVHERAHPRDRRPHRSLAPALRDILKVTGRG